MVGSGLCLIVNIVICQRKIIIFIQLHSLFTSLTMWPSRKISIQIHFLTGPLIFHFNNAWYCYNFLNLNQAQEKARYFVFQIIYKMKVQNIFRQWLLIGDSNEFNSTCLSYFILLYIYIYKSYEKSHSRMLCKLEVNDDQYWLNNLGKYSLNFLHLF